MDIEVLDLILRIASIGYLFFVALGNLAMQPMATLISEGFGTISAPFGIDMTWTYDLSKIGIIGDFFAWWGNTIEHVLGNSFLQDFTVLEGFLYLSAVCLFLIALGRLLGFVIDILDLVIPG